MGLDEIGTRPRIAAKLLRHNTRCVSRSAGGNSRHARGPGQIARPVPPHLLTACVGDEAVQDTALEAISQPAPSPAFVTWSPAAQQCNACVDCTRPGPLVGVRSKTECKEEQRPSTLSGCPSASRNTAGGSPSVSAGKTLANVGAIGTDPHCGRNDPLRAPNINVIQVPRLAKPCASYVRCNAGRSPPSCDDANIAALCALERLGQCKPARSVGYNSAINAGVFAVVGGSY